MPSSRTIWLSSKASDQSVRTLKSSLEHQISSWMILFFLFFFVLSFKKTKRIQLVMITQGLSFWYVSIRLLCVGLPSRHYGFHRHQLSNLNPVCIHKRVNSVTSRSLLSPKRLRNSPSITQLSSGRGGMAAGVWAKAAWCYAGIVCKWHPNKMDASLAFGRRLCCIISILVLSYAFHMSFLLCVLHIWNDPALRN